MATFTAQILIGQSHPYHGGIYPTHYLFLSENSRPAWILVPQNIFEQNKKDDKKITWIPTINNMLEDALLMVAYYVLKDKEIISLAKAFRNKDFIELYDDIEPAKLSELYKKCRDIDANYKLILTVLDKSSIENQINILKNYKMEVEVCTPKYTRLRSVIDGKMVSEGTLD